VGQSGGMATTMRAISQDVLGGPEVLKLVELDRPEAGLSQVLVRVHAAGLNPTDWKHRARRIFLGPPPFVLGWDVSGVVEATGYGSRWSSRAMRSSACCHTRTVWAQRGIRAELLLVEVDHGGMRAIGDLVTQGKLRPVIAGTFPLADAAKAHQAGDTGHVAGKLVLTIR
jgi:NADPH:quinone reductase-like Zn-dependent oxidoreductase